MGLLQYRTSLLFRMCIRCTSSTRLQVFQNATQIVDPQRIRNVGIIAHIDAGSSGEGGGSSSLRTSDSL